MTENTSALAIINSDDLETIQRTGSLLAASGYFDVKGDSKAQIAQMATKIMAGRELGFGPFASVNGIHVIQGKPSVGANLMATAVKNSRRYDYRVRELSDDKCELEFFEIVNGARESIGVSAFTQADAKKANTQNMGKFPRNMLFARAMSNGVRWFCPDVFNGNAVYVPEELDAEIDGEGNVIESAARIVNESTGEIVSGQQPVAGSPYRYANLIDTLSGDCLALAEEMRSLHAQSDGPASDKQYPYLAGLIDDLTQTEGHHAILEILVGRPVSNANRCGGKVATRLITWLAKEKRDRDSNEKIPNQEYRPEVAGYISHLWNKVLEADGQLLLVEEV